ncbi:carbamoyltransferase [Candidatus Daviesbacteria bacterium]|nr:carbamoyltransferase [Candidatus Daviesbacteria bacterium]
MYILGLYYGHNATACLTKDGRVIAAVSEERFNGIKNYKGFPKNAIDYCLSEVGIKSSELDLVVRSNRIGIPIHVPPDFRKDFSINFLYLLHKFINPFRKLYGELAFRYPNMEVIGEFFYTLAVRTIGRLAMEREKEAIAKELDLPKKKILFLDHHLCHAFIASVVSPFNQEKNLVMVLDGEGDDCSASIYIFDRSKYRLISRSSRNSSLGAVYAYVTEFLGMKSNEHEYKVMGLAPYAKLEDVDKIYKKIKDIIFFDEKNPLIFKSKFNTKDILKYLDREFKRIRFDLIAGVVQKLTEERIIEWIEAAIKVTGIKTVILCGGVFMNVKVNQKISQQKSVKKLFIMPSCGDESTPLGACLYALINQFKFGTQNIKPIKDIYWGPQFSDEEVERVIKGRKIGDKFSVKKVKDIEKVTAKLLSEGKIVARLKGRMEFGARALGNRSILANPSDPEVVRVINEQVKNRDFWMPFAPTILQERAKDYLINPKRIDSPFMMLGYDSTSIARKELKAAMHPYDFTLRPQILNEDYNPDYYRLIKEFERLTGIGAVLNTSFNLHGFPIVLGPREALDAFENSSLEHMTLEDYIISKKSI